MRKIKPKSKLSMAEKAPSGPHYPSFGIELEHLPEAKNWKVGNPYGINLEVKMSGITIEDDYERASFDITGIETISKLAKKKVESPKRVSRYLKNA